MAPEKRKRKSDVTSTNSLYDDLFQSEDKEPNLGTKSSETLLQEFLYDCEALESYDCLYRMFNQPFSLEETLLFHEEMLREQNAEFNNMVEHREVRHLDEVYVHAIDLVHKNTTETSRLNKKYSVLPDDVKLMISKCPKCKHKCRLIKKDIGFLVFLFLKDTEEGIKDEDLDSNMLPNEVNDVVEIMNEDAEQQQTQQLEVSSIREEKSIIDRPSYPLLKGSLPLPILPSFPIGQREYFMLSDIQRAFGLREDETYAILAQHWNFEVGTDEEHVKYKDFVVKDLHLGKLDLCFEPSEALEICFKETREYREPTESEFLKAQEGVMHPHLSEPESDDEEEIESDTGPLVEEPDLGEKREGSINIWRESQLVYDENITVKPERDDFLRRSSRTTDLSKDAALKHYLKHLASSDLVIFHMKYSIHGYVPLFAYKTLSKCLGGYSIHKNAMKVSLLEKECAISIFGYAHAMQGSLAGGYLTYTGYALSMGEKDPKKLHPYGKRFLLRHTVFEEVQKEESTSMLQLEENVSIEDMI